MARTYVLSGECTTGLRFSWGSGLWSGFYYSGVNTGRVGRDSGAGAYYTTNIVFDQNQLAALQSKPITSIKLTVTIKEGRVYSAEDSTQYAIGYKRTQYKGEDVLSADSAKDPWARPSATDIGYLRAPSGRIDGGNTPLTIDLTGTSIPDYGYVVGCGTGQNQQIMVTLGLAATLTVVTSEASSWTVAYNKGSYGTGTNVSDTKHLDTALTLRGAIFTRTNYRQDGWSTTDGGAIAYPLGGTYTANAAITLYPHWVATASTVSAPNGTLGTALTITISRAQSTYHHTLSYSFGGASGQIATNVGTSRSWTPPVNLASRIPNAASGTCVIYCTTYDANNNQVGTTTQTSITLAVPSSIKVVVDAVTLAETFASVASKFGAFVQNQSKLSVTATFDTSGAYGATVSTVTTQINGQTLSGNGAVTSAIANYGTLSYSVTIKDSRGRTDTYTGTYNVLAYSAPTATVNAERNASDNTQIDISYSWGISPVNDLNDKTVTLKIKSSSASGYTTLDTITPTAYSGTGMYSATGLLAPESYIVRVEVTDYYSTTTAQMEVAAYGKRFAELSAQDMTIALHMPNTSDGQDHEAFDMVFHKTVDITNRRCFGYVSSAGWYRVLSYAGVNTAALRGGQGIEIRLNIQRAGENHSITFRTVGENYAYWTDETSKSSTVLVDKIRWIYSESNNKAYIDIHYTYSQSRMVGIDFDVHGVSLNEQKRVTSSNLTAVADAPSGETVLTTHTFMANTDRELYVSNNYVKAHFCAVGNVKTVVFSDFKNIPTGVITTVISPSEMAEFIPTIPLGYDFVAMSSNSEHVRLYIDTLGVRAYNYSNNTDVINSFQTVTYV